jgi:hypothetical protein
MITVTKVSCIWKLEQAMKMWLHIFDLRLISIDVVLTLNANKSGTNLFSSDWKTFKDKKENTEQCLELPLVETSGTVTVKDMKPCRALFLAPW